MKKYKTISEYESDLIKRSALPKGFKVGVVPITFYPQERKTEKPLPMNLSMILMDEKTESFGGVFTKNSFPGHPIIHGRKVIESEHAQGVIINNKISNVRCPKGMESIDRILEAFARSSGIQKELFFASSTGIIGWRLPTKEIIDNLDELNKSLSKDSILPLAKGIMTTDNFPKVRSIKIGKGSIVAVAKGAGMIEPNMATMLLFILTDIKISRDDIRASLKSVMDKTFNRISIDSEQSTSDTGLIFSSNCFGGVARNEFESGLLTVCSDLCQDVVRNGEGTAHVLEVTVKGAFSEKDGVTIGKAIVNAPLLKAAIYGNDPNIGRIIQAIGDITGTKGIDIDPERVELSMGGKTLYKNGEFSLSEELENQLSKYLKGCALNEKAIGFPEHMNNVEIVVDLCKGDREATVYGSDLSYEYVRENADYRS